MTPAQHSTGQHQYKIGWQNKLLGHDMIRSQLWDSLTNNCHKGCNIAYLIRMVLVLVIPMTLPVKVKDILVNCTLPSDLRIYSFGLKSKFVDEICS